MKTLKLYDNTVDLQFSEGNHRYKVNGEYVEGVTTTLSKVVNKEGLVPWAAKMVGTYIEENAQHVDGFYQVDKEILDNAKKFHIKKKDEGADVGSIVHNYLELFVKGVLSGNTDRLAGISSSDEKVEKCFNAFIEWDNANKPNYLWSEKIVYSLKHNYCGTADVAFELNGLRYLADFKTSDPRKEWKSRRYTGKFLPYPEHFLQCAAYDVANYEESGQIFDAYMIIYITKGGKLYTFETTEVYSAKQNWLNALMLARWLKRNS